jgi:hypothetical protein
MHVVVSIMLIMFKTISTQLTDAADTVKGRAVVTRVAVMHDWHIHIMNNTLKVFKK